MKRKILIGLMAAFGAATGGCFVAVDEPHHPHVHCVGCGHVYVHGTWH